MQTNFIELAVAAFGFAVLIALLLSLRATPRPLAKPLSLAPITESQSLAVQAEAESAARDFYESGYTTPNPYPVGMREQIIWETTFHSKTMD